MTTIFHLGCKYLFIFILILDFIRLLIILFFHRPPTLELSYIMPLSWRHMDTFYPCNVKIKYLVRYLQLGTLGVNYSYIDRKLLELKPFAANCLFFFLWFLTILTKPTCKLSSIITILWTKLGNQKIIKLPTWGSIAHFLQNQSFLNVYFRDRNSRRQISEITYC